MSEEVSVSKFVDNYVTFDVVIGLAYGDEAKGKIVNAKAKNRKNEYTHCLRFNGGSNAGHTVYVNGKKVVTHIIPTGALHGLKGIIGGGCVLNVAEFFLELEYLRNQGFDLEGKVFIAKNCHIVTDSHLAQDMCDVRIGTTRKGIGPCYEDKIGRNGIRAEEIPELKPYLIDLYEEFYKSPGWKNVLCEGAQAFWLDIDLGDYPYVTSSNTGVGALLNNGISYKDIMNVTGVAKCYDTYVGAKKFHGKDPIFDEIQKVGNEYGATTGRPRQCNTLNLDKLIRAIRQSGTTEIHISKLDVLEQVNFFRFRYTDVEFDFDNVESFKSELARIISLETGVGNITFSNSPETV